MLVRDSAGRIRLRSDFEQIVKCLKEGDVLSYAGAEIRLGTFLGAGTTTRIFAIDDKRAIRFSTVGTHFLDDYLKSYETLKAANENIVQVYADQSRPDFNYVIVERVQVLLTLDKYLWSRMPWSSAKPSTLTEVMIGKRRAWNQFLKFVTNMSKFQKIGDYGNHQVAWDGSRFVLMDWAHEAELAEKIDSEDPVLEEARKSGRITNAEYDEIKKTNTKARQTGKFNLRAVQQKDIWRELAPATMLRLPQGVLMWFVSQVYYATSSAIKKKIVYPDQVKVFRMKGYWIPKSELDISLGELAPEIRQRMIRNVDGHEEVLFLIHPFDEEKYRSFIDFNSREEYLNAVATTDSRHLLVWFDDLWEKPFFIHSDGLKEIKLRRFPNSSLYRPTIIANLKKTQDTQMRLNEISEEVLLSRSHLVPLSAFLGDSPSGYLLWRLRNAQAAQSKIVKDEILRPLAQFYVDQELNRGDLLNLTSEDLLVEFQNGKTTGRIFTYEDFEGPKNEMRLLGQTPQLLKAMKKKMDLWVKNGWIPNVEGIDVIEIFQKEVAQLRKKRLSSPAGRERHKSDNFGNRSAIRCDKVFQL